ncbi:MAG: hypothetical protein LIO62_03875 [Clostridiales bacterium]|nr:hypothetical protein [Clostridiales bacterium]
MKKKNIVTIVVFCVLIFGFSAASILTPSQEFSYREKRALAQLPSFSISDIFDGYFQEDYEDYIDDQFFARDNWVDFSTQVQLLTGKKDINSVYIGKDDYLLEKYTNADFDEEIVDDNIYYLTDFLNTVCDNIGQEHTDLLFIPGKTTVMQDKLPDNASAYDSTWISSQFDENYTLDLTQTLIEHSDEYIYYRTDHHWTTLGAYYAYEQFCECKGFEPVQYSVSTFSDDFFGTTYNKLSLSVESDTVELYDFTKDVNIVFDNGESASNSFYIPEAIEEDNDVYRVFLGGNTAKIEITTSLDTGRTLLLLKDSFSNCFVPFLANHYDKIIMIDLRYVSDTIWDIIENDNIEYTDVLVMFNYEKFMQDEYLYLLESE